MCPPAPKDSRDGMLQANAKTGGSSSLQQHNQPVTQRVTTLLLRQITFGDENRGKPQIQNILVVCTASTLKTLI